MTGPDPREYGWWLASRASGLVALALITLSVALGLMMAGKVLRGPGIARKLAGRHEELALAGLVAIAVHMITLVGDRWLNPGPTGVLVPFAMGYKPLFTGLGVIAAYMAALLGLSFYFRRRIGARLWRSMHRATIVVYVLSVVHVVGAGTDASETWLQLALVGTASPIAVLFAFRIMEGRQAARKAAERPAPAARPAPSAAPAIAREAA